MSPAIPVPDRLVGERVAVRPLCDRDVTGYVAAFATDPALGLTVGLLRDPDEAAARATIAATVPDAESGTRLVLAVASADTDSFVGMVALSRFAWRHRRCELGYWLDSSARGRGYATQAARLLLDWAFPTLDLSRVEISTSAENLPSQALADRLGFTREARQIQRSVERGRRVDVIRFALLREERPDPES